MTAPAPYPTATVVPRGRLRKGALSFAALTVAGLVGLFILGAPEGPVPAPADLRPGFLLLALGGGLVDIVLGGLRFQIFIRRAHPGSPLALPIRADLAGRFVGAVTPSQSGGGPAQVFVLHRGGVPLPEALSLLLVNLISTLLFFVLAGGLSAWIFRDFFGDGALRSLVCYGFVVVVALLGLMVTALVRPEMVSRPLARLAHRSARGRRPETLMGRSAALLVSSLEQYRVACHRFVRQDPWLPLASFGLTVLIYLNKFGLAWLVIRGLGVERDFAVTVALMALVHFCVFLAPSPGGSGIAEVATGAFVSILLPGSLVGPFTLVYRALIMYGPAAAGALVLLAELEPGSQRPPTAGEPARKTPSRGHAGPSPGRVALGLLLATGLVAAAPAGASDGPCPLCAPEAPATTPLLRAEVAAAARALAERNRREMARIDACLREGRLGPPESPAARARAQLLARLTLANWYSFLLPFVTDPDRVRTVHPDALAAVVARYSEAVVVPLPRLRELRLGRGHVCARYDLGGKKEKGQTVLGGRRLPYRVDDRRVDGALRRVLGLDWGSAGMGKVEVLVAEHYGFRLARSRITHEDGSPSEIFLALDVSGAWVHRCGIHRPAAFAFWTTRPDAPPPHLPHTPRVGSLIYIPGLRFRLPLLPDIDLDDVRVLDLPMPFLDTEDLRRGTLPDWLPTTRDLTFESWATEGPVPANVRAQLPTS
jgi:uncharacterized protein (TIRG00374 family)